MAPQKKVKINVYLSPQQRKALQDISDRTMIPVASLIRRGVDSVIKEYSKR
jgi:hypothetical protein